MADRDLQIRGDDYPDPEIRGEEPVFKKNFGRFGRQFGLKTRGGGGGPGPSGPSPRSAADMSH